MKIEKITKLDNNEYQLILEDNTKLNLYDDAILKSDLLLKKNIDNVDDLISLNNTYAPYYESLKYISKRVRCRSEVFKYLSKKYSDDLVNSTIDKLFLQGYINDNNYIEAYVNDQINLGNYGPVKIKRNLLDLEIVEDDIDCYLDNLDINIWEDKVKKYINKQISINRKYSNNMLRNKVFNNLISLGYDREMVYKYTCLFNISEDLYIEKEYDKLFSKLSRKFSGEELYRQLLNKLLSKGFNLELVKSLIAKKKNNF